MTRDDGYTRYTVRIPTPLYERVKEAAGEKSVNAEIVAALEERYPALDVDVTIDQMIDYVSGGVDEADMRARAKSVNKALHKHRKNLKIIVLDDVGAKAMRAKVIAAAGSPATPDDYY